MPDPSTEKIASKQRKINAWMFDFPSVKENFRFWKEEISHYSNKKLKKQAKPKKKSFNEKIYKSFPLPERGKLFQKQKVLLVTRFSINKKIRSTPTPTHPPTPRCQF